MRLPKLPAGADLYVGAFEDLGRSLNVGFGPVPLSYQEITSGAYWMKDKEKKLIRQMSIAYLTGMREAEDPLAVPPMER